MNHKTECQTPINTHSSIVIRVRIRYIFFWFVWSHFPARLWNKKTKKYVTHESNHIGYCQALNLICYLGTKVPIILMAQNHPRSIFSYIFTAIKRWDNDNGYQLQFRSQKKQWRKDNRISGINPNQKSKISISHHHQVKIFTVKNSSMAPVTTNRIQSFLCQKIKIWKIITGAIYRYSG